MKNEILKHFFAAIFIALIFTTVSFSQTADEMKRSQKSEQLAAADYKAKNFSGYLENIRQADKMRPGHPRLIYNLSIAYALNNQKDASLKSLERLAAMGLYFPVENNENFTNLSDLPKFREIQTLFNKNKLAAGKSEKAFALDQTDLITEGIAFNPLDKRFFIGSIHRRKIVAVDENFKSSDFSRDSDGLWSVSGMKVDEKRQILWVCSTAFPQMKGFDKTDDGKSGIFKYDLKTGALIRKYLLSNESGNHALGDLIINKNGDVFATDSVSPRVYLIDSKKDTLEVFLESDAFFSLQGLAFSPDEKTLFVADYSKGISKIDLKTKKLDQLNPAANITLLGIDGLYFHKGKLIAIQNGVNPNRVVRLIPDKNFTEILSFETIEAAHESFDEPTHGVFKDGEFYFIANSQWNLVNEKGELTTEKLQKPQILKVKL